MVLISYEGLINLTRSLQCDRVCVQMTPVCPFIKAARPDDASSRKPGENQHKPQVDHEGRMKSQSGDSAVISPKCPFGYDSPQAEHKGRVKSQSGDSAVISPKCPFGYDSQTFKLGPFSCMICQALLFEASQCVPCSHKFCKVCILRFQDCPLCGAGIEKIEPDSDLQKIVDHFIEGHARIKRSHATSDAEGVGEKGKVVYEDVSLERGAFLVQQAMRAFRANNVESAKSRLGLCVDDIREQIKTLGRTPELCSQLGAVLGMLGDCCRAAGDSESAVSYFEESVEFLLKLPLDDLEITHTLSVSLNKIGDLKYYGGDLQTARTYYHRSLDVRRIAIKHNSGIASQILDVAVSLAKVADVDRNLGNEKEAVDGFQEAIQLLESLTLSSKETCLKERRLSVLEFVKSQVSQGEAEVSTIGGHSAKEQWPCEINLSSNLCETLEN